MTLIQIIVLAVVQLKSGKSMTEEELIEFA